METECLSVCTRTKFVDYCYKGSCGKSFYEVMRNTEGCSGLVDIIDTTGPAVLVLDSELGYNLFVSGIPTGRKDKAGAAIRWSFHLRREDAADWFVPLVQAFKNGDVCQLGEKLDKICGFSPENDNFEAPSMDKFLAALPKPEHVAPPPQFKLWTDFVPTDEDKIQNLVDELDMPAGEIIIYHNGQDTTYIKKNRLPLLKLAPEKR